MRRVVTDLRGALAIPQIFLFDKKGQVRAGYDPRFGCWFIVLEEDRARLHASGLPRLAKEK